MTFSALTLICALYELETFLLVVWNARFEEDGVGSVLCRQQWSVAHNLRKELDALVPLVEVRLVGGKRDGTARASERPARRHLHRRLPSDVRDEEVHGDILAVHELVDIVAYGGGQRAPVRPQVVAVDERRARQHHAEFAAVIRVV